MELKEFVNFFAEQFDDTPIEEIVPTTIFKQLNEWTSLTALSVIAMVDENYGVLLKGDDIRNSNTIEDLYKIVKSRKQ